VITGAVVSSVIMTVLERVDVYVPSDAVAVNELASSDSVTPANYQLPETAVVVP